MSKKYSVNPIGLVVLMTAVFISLTAVFSFVQAELAEGVTQEQVSGALKDLSQIYGQPVATQAEAKEICNMDKYVTDCAEIGRDHNLFPPERATQVNTILDEIKGQVADQIKNCQNIECLVGVAEDLASKISRKDPVLAAQTGLTPTIVREKKEIVELAKSAGLTIDQCIEMDPDTASVELLRGCAKLAKENKIRKYVPIEARAQIDAIGDSTERTVQLKQALSGGQFQCGDNTIQGCGNFCLNPGAEARAAGASAIPAVCKEIAAKIFGAQGVKELENSYSRVSKVADYYYKKAQNFVFTTLDGRTLTNSDQIGQYMEEQGKAGNVEAISKGMDFMVSQGFATQADKDFAVKMVGKFREKGGVSNFDVCVQDPKACRDFINDDFQNDFDVMGQVFEIMRQELGFSPDLCEQGGFDQSIGLKCLEGGKRALPKIEALASKYPEVRSIVEEIRSHLQRGDQLAQRKDEFRDGTFSGPGGCKNERECFVYCSNSANGPECIAFGSKQGLSGFTGDQAVTKYQQYDYSLNRSAIEKEYITNYKGPSDQPPYGPPYGVSYPGPGYPPSPPGSQSQYGPSPECLRAITSGDFAAAKQVCNVAIGGPQPVPGQPFPSVPICPALPYVQCPEGQYHESFRNSDGCFIDGPCKPIPTYSPGPYPTGGPYPTYSPGPYPSYSPGPGSSVCSKSLISLLGDGCHQMYTDLSGRQIYCDGPMSKSAKEGDSVTVPGCSNGVGGPGPYPTYSPYPSPGTCPAGYHYHGEQGGFCMNDREDYSATCYSADGKTTIKCPTQPTGQCVSPQWWDPAKGYCVGSTSPGPWPSPGTSSCPAGYHYHGDSGGFCMNDREDYAGTCYTADGKTTTTCPKPTYTPGPSYTPAPSCPSGQWWDYARNVCTSSTATYTPYPSCPAGQWWDNTTNACKSTTYPSYTPYSGYCGDNVCSSSETSSSCPSDCRAYAPTYSPTSTTYTPYPTTQYTPYPTTAYTPPPTPSCPSGQWWDYASNSCTGSTTTYTPPPYSPPPSTYSPPPSPPPPPPPTSALYNHFANLHCAGLDRIWDGKYCQPEGFLAQIVENTWANFGKLLGF